ncbi:MAG: adenosine-specific kinase [Candidatus Bathyarchaeota archaeon]
MELKTVRVEAPEGCNLILGTSHFIKSVEDLHEAMVNSVPEVGFGIAFCESSGPCLIRSSGNNKELMKKAIDSALAVGAGHSFIIFLRDAYPINVLNAVKSVPEVCTVYCATDNPVDVIIAETKQGRGILGVVDGFKPKGVETEKDAAKRKSFLRKIGYKL